MFYWRRRSKTDESRRVIRGANNRRPPALTPGAEDVTLGGGDDEVRVVARELFVHKRALCARSR